MYDMTEYTDCCECLTEDEVQPPEQPDNTWLWGLGLLAIGYVAYKESK